MPRQLLGTAIAANTITTTQLQTTVVNQISAGGGPRVSSLIYPGNDTAGNTVGGQTVYINGSGFETNNAIYINGNAVPSKSFISASNLSFTTPALSAGIYPVYVINTDTGATAIFVPGYISSAEPAWVTSAGSLSTSQDELGTWTYNLSATGDAPITYALAAGSSLPGGVSLAANGLISGTISSPTGNVTTYTFSVVATDAQNQDSTRQFTVTTTTGEGLLFANNVLLIHADGTNNGNNHAFLDSSNNNFTITRNGNATQGSFSPFSQTGWSNFFSANTNYLTGSNTAFNISNQTLAWTFECWVFPITNGSFFAIGNGGAYGNSFYIDYGNGTANKFRFGQGNGSSANPVTITTSNTYSANQWHHVAVTNDINGVRRLFINGVQDGTQTYTSASLASGTTFIINGVYDNNGLGNSGGSFYASNYRFINGSTLYTSNFTPSTTPLTAVSNTVLLTCQSNRFIDNSTNAITITRNGDVSVQAFSPFAPAAAYSTANVGGSAYFDGTGDYLSWSGTTFSGDLTIECWLYKTAVDSSGYTILFHNTNTAINHQFQFDGGNTPGSISLVLSGSTVIPASGTAVITNSWSHLAWVRQGSTFRAYVNGIQQGTGTSSESFNINLIGQYHFGGNDINGYISGLRMVNGTCLYPNGTTFTPPTSPPTNIANTSLLLNFTNAQIFDQTAKNVLETVGDAKVSTAQYKYGTGSMVFDGTGDYLIAPSKICDFGTGNFTVEGWIRVSNTTGAKFIADSRNTGSDAGFGLLLEDSTGYKLRVYRNGGYLITSSSTISSNTWYHVAFVRNNSNSFLYIDGTQVANSSDTNSYTQAGSFRIGAGWNNGDFFNGYIDDLRITKGYARYTSNFTPPTSALKDK